MKHETMQVVNKIHGSNLGWTQDRHAKTWIILTPVCYHSQKSVSCQSGSAAACPSVHAILGFDIFLVLRVLSFMCVETATPYTLL